MPIEKPTKPTNLVPRSFGGEKTNFSEDLQASGFEPNIPQTYNGDNLNYQLNATGQELDYVETVVDFINNAPVDSIVYVNENNQLDYMSKNNLGGGGLEIGDIGISAFGINENQGTRRYLNGQIILDNAFPSFTKKIQDTIALYPSLVCTEDEWQAISKVSVGGQCGKFVLDSEAGTIRLPRIIMPIQGLTDLSKLGELVEAGLPNHTHNLVITYDQGTGGSSPNSPSTASPWNIQTTYTTSGASNPTYGKSNTVQQEQIQYPYFIQVATGSETEDNIINEIELNNPFSLLDYKYSEYELNNLSWLRSNGQWNSKTVYPAVYELLLKIYNGTETKAGVSVKLSTASYTDTDFVLNTAEETFRLPIKVKLASGKAVVGNGMTIGITNGSQNAGVVYAQGSGFTGLAVTTSSYGQNVGSAVGSGTITQKSIGLTTDPANSGIELSDANLYLYFYVGETVQNANLINAGRIEEIVVNKLDRSNKQEIMSWGIPDYANGITPAHPTSSAPFTAPSDGIFVDSFYYSTSNSSSLFINGIQTSIVMRTGESYRDNKTSVTVPLSKGDVIYWSTGATATFGIGFYPFKGSN